MRLPLEILSYLFKFNNQWKYNQKTNTIMWIKNIYTFCISVKNHSIYDLKNGSMIIVVKLQIYRPNYKYYFLQKVFESLLLNNFSISLNKNILNSLECIEYVYITIE